MKKLAMTIVLLTAMTQQATAAEQGYTPLQQYLYSESGYAPPVLGYAPTQPVEQEQYTTAYVAPAGSYENESGEPEAEGSSTLMSLEDL